MLERRTSSAGVVYYVSPLLEQIGVPHAFSTRIGGSAGDSPPPFDSFNLGNPNGCELQDDYPRIYRHFERFQALAGCGDRPRLWVHQVHGGNVMLVRRGDGAESGTKADAIVGNDPARALSVRVADCVPVLLSSNDGNIVAAVHSGWRGVIAEVIPNAFAAMRTMTDRPIFAAIGPCIGLDAFEVGAEVLQQFAAAFGPAAPMRRRDDGKGHVDLRAAIRRQLVDAGVGTDCIDTTDCCTFRDRDEFFSHRRDNGVTGRMAAVISARAT